MRGACLASLLLFLLLLAGCGQKGDLYLPDEDEEVGVPAPSDHRHV